MEGNSQVETRGLSGIYLLAQQAHSFYIIACVFGSLGHRAAGGHYHGVGDKTGQAGHWLGLPFWQNIAPTCQHCREPFSPFIPERGPERLSQAPVVTQPGACPPPEAVL